MKKLSEIKVCVGVTSCATGIAHTYMAADAIKKACKKRGKKIERFAGKDDILFSCRPGDVIAKPDLIFSKCEQ